MTSMKDKEERRFWCPWCSEKNKDFYFKRFVYSEGKNMVQCPKCDNYVNSEWQD